MKKEEERKERGLGNESERKGEIQKEKLETESDNFTIASSLPSLWHVICVTGNA